MSMNLKKAFDAFGEVLNKFPDSKYAQDSTDRMTYLMNKIAEYDLHGCKILYLSEKRMLQH